jgi:hypothetical protein
LCAELINAINLSLKQEKIFVNPLKFTQHYKIIYDKFIFVAGDLWPHSNIGFSKFLGHDHDGRVRAWKKGQWPSAYDCWIIHQKLGFNLQWLLTGEGEMLRTEGAETATKLGGAADPSATDQAAKINKLEAEIKRLQNDLLVSKDEVIALYRQRSSEHHGDFSSRTGNAPTGATATSD